MAQTERKGVAFVTGASRGIGASAAVALARRGYDVAVSARTVREGTAERRITKGYDKPLSGSIESVMAQIEALGRRAFGVPMDLTDRVAVAQGAQRVLNEFGRCDILCHVGVYQEPNGMKWLLEAPLEDFDKHYESSVIAPVIMYKTIIPSMLKQGGGVIMNMSSYVATHDPAEDANWGFPAYASGKAAGARAPGYINSRYLKHGIRAYNGDPGLVVLPDVWEEARNEFAGDNFPACPPEAVGEAVAWLVTEPEAERFVGKLVYLPGICEKHNLLKGWGGPGSDWPPKK